MRTVPSAGLKDLGGILISLPLLYISGLVKDIEKQGFSSVKLCFDCANRKLKFIGDFNIRILLIISEFNKFLISWFQLIDDIPELFNFLMINKSLLRIECIRLQVNGIVIHFILSLIDY